MMHVSGEAQSSVEPLAELDEEEAFPALLQSWQRRMEHALARRLPRPGTVPARLHEAMRYSVLGGGKRVRPALMFATARTLGLDAGEVEGAACAIEIIHSYSLVHDDLPGMDDDDLRRGKPTCHVAFDEATAILVGDALQPLAFQLLAGDESLPAAPAIRLELIRLLAHASGSLGMTGGQAIDLAVPDAPIDLSYLEDLHARKTGALIRASVLMAAACVPALSPALRTALDVYATSVGLAFQIQDDLLDAVGDAAVVGKPVRADEAAGKRTFVAMLGVAGSRERAELLHAQALQALELFGPQAAPLRSLCGWLLKREY